MLRAHGARSHNLTRSMKPLVCHFARRHMGVNRLATVQNRTSVPVSCGFASVRNKRATQLIKCTAGGNVRLYTASRATLSTAGEGGNNSSFMGNWRSFGPVGRFFEERRIQGLKTSMENTPSEENITEYVQAMVEFDPKEATLFLEKGWEEKTVPCTQPFLIEYIKAVANQNELDSLNFAALSEMAIASGKILDPSNPHVAAAAAAVNPTQTAGAASQTDTAPGGSAGATAAAGGAAAGAAEGEGVGMGGAAMNGAQPPRFSGSNQGYGAQFGAGSSPQNPLYIAQQEPTFNWKNQAWKVIRFGVGTAILVYIVTTIFTDEKGKAGGGIRSSLGMSSVVRLVERSDKTFDDVVGVDEAKAELQEIVLYLKDPKRFTRLGGRLPKGVLLTGPPGTGKTLLARAIAGEAGVPFFCASGSEFEEMYVGVGAKRVRELFEAAKTNSPCIIFIDEIDAIGGSRQVKEQSAMKMTLNQLLVELDGFQQNNGVIVIAATNFPDSLDAALLRPGRFDKNVNVPMPDIGGRQAILEHYAKKIPMAEDVNLANLARGTPGFSGAELFNLMNQAALKASVDGLAAVGMGALEYAKDKLMMGAERKSAVISLETMKMTAYHEAGHALVALRTEGCDPIHKATIMPRGRSLGMVMQLPDGDQTSMSRKQMLARLDVCMGGRVAEELIFGPENVTSGASSDIQQATRLARAMVTKWGLSEKVGIIFLADKDKTGGSMQADVDQEVRKLLTSSYNRAKALLEAHKGELELIAQGLMDFESLSGSEIVDIVNGKKPNMNGVRSQKPSRVAKPIVYATNKGAAPVTGATAGAAASDLHEAESLRARKVQTEAETAAGRQAHE